jgi:hypothetical protein
MVDSSIRFQVHIFSTDYLFGINPSRYKTILMYAEQSEL